MNILVTGAGGFIGYHTCLSLCNMGHQVIGIDNFNNYYDINLKKKRVYELKSKSNFKFYTIDLTDQKILHELFEQNNFDKVIHLAAQAGVQFSISNPSNYIDCNIQGFFNVMNEAKNSDISHFIYASSSSVYGSNSKVPFSEEMNCSTPISFYAATKIANEAMAHSYSSIYGIKTTGLRFFTVYGPYGRPDMSPFIFANAISNSRPIKVYNNGDLKRDFTYIDDAVSAIELIVNKDYESLKISSIYNVGSNSPIPILDFIKLFELYLNKKAIINFSPLLKGDVLETFADIALIQNDFGFKPIVSIEKGVQKFLNWYKNYTQS